MRKAIAVMICVAGAGAALVLSAQSLAGGGVPSGPGTEDAALAFVGDEPAPPPILATWIDDAETNEVGASRWKLRLENASDEEVALQVLPASARHGCNVLWR